MFDTLKEEKVEQAAVKDKAQPSKRKGMGVLAVEAGLISADQLALLLHEQEKTGRPIPVLLQELFNLSADAVRSLIAMEAGIESVDLSKTRIDPEALKKVSGQFAADRKVIPIALAQNRLTVAMANPFELSTLDQLQFTTRLYIDARFAPESTIREAISRHYGAGAAEASRPETREEKGGYAGAQEGDETLGVQVVRLVDTLIGRAVREEATDIHIEPEEKNLRIRVRIDGILHGRPSVSKMLQPAVTTRIKIMASMDIAENRLPQDGRIGFALEGKNYDLRVSTFPTIFGEKIVMRILDKERMVVGLEHLGFSPLALEAFRKSVQRPNGIILVTGPTGSGKTTTLYSTLAFVTTSEKNIMTLEDPVEYEISDLNQSQVNVKAGLTFASGLRAMLRQDPDIILVGEMRDAETVDVAIRAALTGHLVFSTLHTNDAVGAIPRLLDMDVNPTLMASAFVAIVGQRLVRKICTQCREAAVPDRSLLQVIGLNPATPEFTFYRGKGCMRCFQTGYRGRVAIFEVLVVSPAIAQLIAQRSSMQAILQKAREEGMTNIMEDGIQKAARGVTTLDEVIRVAYQP
ncbi:MAG: type II/IV secretion system protein [Deltaproteobacteria bacterium]|nr:type II/IV secretion system protein [Deltaproteobacteria bacterium]